MLKNKKGEKGKTMPWLSTSPGMTTISVYNPARRRATTSRTRCFQKTLDEQGMVIQEGHRHTDSGCLKPL